MNINNMKSATVAQSLWEKTTLKCQRPNEQTAEILFMSQALWKAQQLIRIKRKS